MENPQSRSEGSIRVGKILVGSLMLGVLMLSLLMVYLVQSGQRQPVQGMDVLLYVLAALWPSTAGFALLIKGPMTKKARGEWEKGTLEESSLPPMFMILTIIRAALLEGPGLFGAIVFMLTGNALALLGPALSLAGLGLIFPTVDKYESFKRDVTAR